MTFLRKTIIFLLLFSVFSLEAQQSSIRFYETSLDNALKMAQREDKAIFVDTYAPWCKPCKMMTQEFRDRDLASYYNTNFINVKINMESELAKDYLKYGVVFLPTFLILDKYGNVKIKIDRLMKAKELLNIGKQINQGDSFYASSPPTTKKQSTTSQITTRPTSTRKIKGVKKSPVTGATIPNTIEKKKEVVVAEKPADEKITGSISSTQQEEEKILYVLGDDQDMPPEILRQEAYFRMKLMDGSHIPAAKKYLQTQDEWNKEENIRFIFDFLYNASAEEFEYMIHNRRAFEAILGKQKIDETVEILVYTKLNQGFPRPSLKEAQTLFSYIDPSTANQKANAYYIDRLYQDGKKKLFRDKAKEYLIDINPENDQILYKLAFSYTDKELASKKTLNMVIRIMEKATTLNSNSYEYFELLAGLYYKDKQKKKARETAQLAISKAKKYNKEYGSTMILLEMIEEL